MKMLKDMIGAALVWIDISMMTLAAAISVMTGLAALKTWSAAQTLWVSLLFPLQNWDDWTIVSAWAASAFQSGSLATIGWAWLYTCSAGFLGTVCVLSGYEAFCRLRVRLG
jgi:hypothetical protein